MSILWIIVVLGFIALNIWIYRSKHPVARVLFYFMSVIGVLVLVGSVFVMQDVKNFNENFPISKNLFLLSENGELISALAIDPSQGNAAIYFNDSDFSSMAEMFKFGDEGLDDISEDYYKTLVFSMPVFDEMVTFDIFLDDYSFNKSFALTLLRSKIPRDLVANRIIKSRNLTHEEGMYLSIKDQLGSDVYVKQLVFAMLSNEFLSKGTESSANMLLEIKKGNIIIYPKTLLFKFVDYLPENIVRQAISVVEKRGA